MRGSAPESLPARDRRNNGHLVAVLDRGGEAAAKAHVLVVQVEVHERIRFTVFVAQPGRERRKPGRHVGDGLAQRPARRLDRASTPVWAASTDGKFSVMAISVPPRL